MTAEESIDFQVAFGVLTVSDTCFRDPTLDQSGPTAIGLLKESSKFDVALQDCVADDTSLVKSLVLKWIDSGLVQVILTLGGTGLTRRDITPQTIASLITPVLRMHGLEHALYTASLKATPMAAISRLVAGIKDEVILITLPGSPRAVAECFPVILPVIQHAVNQLKGWNASGGHRLSYSRSVCASPGLQHAPKMSVINRPRQSNFPMISVDEAQRKMFQVVHSLLIYFTKVEAVFHKNALNRILAYTLKSQTIIPPCDVSIMDGYAVRFSDGAGVYTVAGSLRAGDNNILGNQKSFHLEKNTCVRVNTGGPLPPGADCVVPVEQTRLLSTRSLKKTSHEQNGEEEEEGIEILSSPAKIGQFIRPAGFDLSKSYRFSRGLRLGPAELALLAGAGLLAPWPTDSLEVIEQLPENSPIPQDVGDLLSQGGHLPCFRQPRIGVFSTGNELIDGTRSAQKNNSPSCSSVCDTNRPLLLGLLHKHGYHRVTDMGIVLDKEDRLAAAFRNAFDHCDVLITTGGVSMGERDLVLQVLMDRFGAIVHFGRVFMKPGKPTAFVSVPRSTGLVPRRSLLVVCLPGNPVSTYVTAHLFVLPLLRCLQSVQPEDDRQQLMATHLPTTIRVRLLHSVSLGDRPDYRRARLVWSSSSSSVLGQGGCVEAPGVSLPLAQCDHVGSQLSSRLVSCLDSNLLLLLPPADDEAGLIQLDSGSVVEALYLGD